MRIVLLLLLSFVVAPLAQASEPGSRSIAEASVAVTISPYVNWSFGEDFLLEYNQNTGRGEFCLSTNTASGFYQIRTSHEGVSTVNDLASEAFSGCRQWSLEFEGLIEPQHPVTLLLEPVL